MRKDLFKASPKEGKGFHRPLLYLCVYRSVRIFDGKEQCEEEYSGTIDVSSLVSSLPKLDLVPLSYLWKGNWTLTS